MIGPSSLRPHSRTITYGFNPPQSMPGPHKDNRMPCKEMTLREEMSDVSKGSYSMEAHYGSESLKEAEHRCITERSESTNKQYDLPFSNDTNTESNQCLNLSDSMGSLSLDGKRSVVEKSICPTIPGNLKNPLDTEDPIDGAIHDPDQTHVKRGRPTSDEPDHSETNTDKRDNYPKTAADIVPVKPFACSASSEPVENAVKSSNAPKPDKEMMEKSLPVDSEDISPGDTTFSTNSTDMVKEVQQNTFSETHDPKIQRCSHLGSASPFQKADSVHDLRSNKDGQLLSALVDVSDISKVTNLKVEVKETSKEFPGDTCSVYMSDKQGDTITEPVMKTSGPSYLQAPLCSSPSSEDQSFYKPQRKKDGPLKTPFQDEGSGKHTSRLPHADDVPVSSNQIVPAAQLGGTPDAGTTYVFINDCSNIELSGDVHLVNVSTKTEGSDTSRSNPQRKTKKKYDSSALMPRNHKTSSNSTCTSTSSSSATLEKSSTEILPKPQAAAVCEVTPQSRLGRSQEDAQEGSRSPRDVTEGASGLPAMESWEKSKISEQNDCGVVADKSNSSKDERKKKSKRKATCFPFLKRRNKKN